MKTFHELQDLPFSVPEQELTSKKRKGGSSSKNSNGTGDNKKAKKEPRTSVVSDGAGGTRIIKRRRKKEKTGEKREANPNSGLMKPMRLSASLSALLGGVEVESRSQVVSISFDFLLFSGNSFIYII